MSTKCILTLATLLACGTAGAGTLSFEDLNPTPWPFVSMPADYHGLAFQGWFVGPDYSYAPASGVVDLFTDFADPSNPYDYNITDANNAVTSAMAFVFEGAFFSGYSGVTLLMYKDGTLVHTSDSIPDAPDLTPYGPTFLSSGYAGAVDKVVVRGVQGFFAMDDFQFSALGANTIPEPGALALVLTGLVIGGAALSPQSRRRVRA